jgi:pimeloyl-ACP methyl ester carboxylesterase
MSRINTDKPSIYKTLDAKKTIMELYEKKLEACNIKYEETYINTFAGPTHVIIVGDKLLPPVVLLHGINAGSPLALEAMINLEKSNCIYAIDSIGQATKSSETRLPLNDNSYGIWLSEVCDKLQLNYTTFISVSFGAFFLQKLIAHNPKIIKKAIFIVPSGFANGPLFKSLLKLTYPLIKFLISKKETDLINFMDAFYNEKDRHSIDFQKAVLLGLNMDYRKPPIVKMNETINFNAPVYLMVADEDIFFPGDKTIKLCKKLFTNLKDIFVLEGSKHIPDRSEYPKIAAKINEWLIKN